MENQPIPVVCDRCRAEGLAGEGEFARLHRLGDLLDFRPVPLQISRVGGHSPETQRAFIAALAVLGSPARAAAAIGKATAGAERLRTLAGAEEFNRAWDLAMEMFAEREKLRLADSLSALTRAAPPPPPARSADLPEPEPEPDEEAELTPKLEELRIDILRMIVGQYLAKLEQERSSRLQGRIAEADFYLRQITCLEVSLDVVSGDGMTFLREVRRDGHDLLHIAETELSRLLDEARRRHWEACGDPPRPEYPPRHLLKEKDGFSVEPLEAIWGAHPEGLSPKEQKRRYDETYARDAEAQVKWEAQARRDYERRRASGAANDQEPRQAGQPARPATGLTARDSLP